MVQAQVYTPQEVAEMLKVNKRTVYELIERGEIVAKKLGRLYRIPRKSINFVFDGLDADIKEKEEVDKVNLIEIREEITSYRAEVSYGK